MNLLEQKDNLTKNLNEENKNLDFIDTCNQAALNKLKNEFAHRSQEIDDNYRPLKQQIYNNISEINAELAKVNALIDELNTFEISELAPILAEIISKKESEKYTNQLVTADIRKVYSNQYGYDIQDSRYSIDCIKPESSQDNYIIQEVFVGSGIDLDFDKNISVLGVAKTKIEIDTKTLTLNDNCITNLIVKYPYLKEFIDYVIKIRCSENMSAKDLSLIYQDYVSLYQSKTKIKIRK